MAKRKRIRRGRARSLQAKQSLQSRPHLSLCVQCIFALAAFACKVRAWRVTKTLAKSPREMAVIAKAGCVCNLSKRLTCAKGGLAL